MYGRKHEKEARIKLEQILGAEITDPKKFIDKGEHKLIGFKDSYRIDGKVEFDYYD